MPWNAPRRQQYFSIWIRPVGTQYAHHLLKAAANQKPPRPVPAVEAVLVVEDANGTGLDASAGFDCQQFIAKSPRNDGADLHFFQVDQVLVDSLEAMFGHQRNGFGNEKRAGTRRVQLHDL